MDFLRAFNFIIEIEGEYSEDPKDPGGATKWGISQRAYPYLDIKNLSIIEAFQIYRRDYWDAVDADQVPLDLRLALFDCAVNQGPRVALSLYTPLKYRPDVLELFLAARAMRYVNTRNFGLYGRGWMKRLFLVALETRRKV